LRVGFEKYGNRLQRKDGERGLCFYSGFGIFQAVQRHRSYNERLYCDLLRSEHIPFNFFVPFEKDKSFCRQVFDELLNHTIKSIDEIRIEYAPKDPEKYLNDKTSFDAYIEFTHQDNRKGFIGIEVKYTEREYELKPGSKEERDVNDPKSRYSLVTQDCGIYKPGAIAELRSDKYRQIWRNQLLGESMLIVDHEKFKHFTSLLLFPKGNTHFVQASKDYVNFLATNQHRFLSLTYEDFIAICRAHCPNDDFFKWLEYLSERYIVTD
jgi:hypothetical protein